MKKLLAVLLAILCAFSAFSVCAINEDELEDIFGDHFGVPDEEGEEEVLSYGIHYEMALLSTQTILYKPSPSITFNAPTDMVVTNDFPIAVDHNWVCWKDQKTGKLYYPGDTIHVDGKITLIAVWEEKTDNYPGFVRSAIAGVQALIKLIEKFLGVFNLINSTKPTEEPTTQPTTSEIYVVG